MLYLVPYIKNSFMLHKRQADKITKQVGLSTVASISSVV
jgi:hypothetical protein